MTIVTMLMVVVVMLVLKLVWVAGKWRDQSRRAHVGDAEEWKTGSGEWSLSIPCHEGETAAADCVRHISVISSRNKASIYYPPPIGKQSIVMCMSLCVSVCVCLSAIISSKLRIQSSPKFLCMLPVAMARSSYGGVVICYVLLV